VAPTYLKEKTMGLLRTALIFGAGYVLGRPEGRQQLRQLAGRPEVTQLRQQAVDTVSATVETGRQRLTKSADSARSTDSVGTSAGSRGRRLPSFPRRGARPAASSTTVPTAGAASADAVSTDVLSSDALFSDKTSTGTSGTGTSGTGTSSTGTSGTGTSSTGTSGTGTTGTDTPSPPTPRQR
jgi:hypothetical protein